MSKPAFTPGPWREKKGDGVIYEISRPYKIATVGTGGKCTAEYRANIALMAAAPDMYEALKQVLGWIDSWETSFDDDPEWLETRHRIDAILSKVQP